MRLLRCLYGFLLCCFLLGGLVHAQNGIPAEVSAALARAKVPLDAVTFLVTEVDGKAPPRLSHRAQVAVNPASLMKLVTTFAALETLGPTFAWSTPVYLEGAVRDGTLFGKLYIKGQGDPKLVLERLWLLLRRVQGLGIKTIARDVVLDRTAFETNPSDPGDFDGERLRPYNAAPDALLINYKSVVMTFVPERNDKLSDRNTSIARISFDPPLAGVQMQASVPLTGGECGDYRATLKADLSDPGRIRFGGSYPASCGERVWPLAYADPATYSVRVVEALWQEMGGQLGGRVVEGRVPATLQPVFEMTSPALSEIIRDVNKFSNNVMAQQLFLSLSLQQKGIGSLQASRELVQGWWNERFGATQTPVLDNGSGLSRSERISAQALAQLLQYAWRSPLMPELMSSLPISGVDGTLRRMRNRATGVAHLKTGSLRDVTGVAGYVLANSGKRYVLVAIANHAYANAVRPAMDALVEWTQRDP